MWRMITPQGNHRGPYKNPGEGIAKSATEIRTTPTTPGGEGRGEGGLADRAEKRAGRPDDRFSASKLDGRLIVESSPADIDQDPSAVGIGGFT